MNNNLRVYISSTSTDLKEYRAVVISALHKMDDIQPVCMEDYVAQDKLPVDKCLEDVALSNIYVGIFAWRYGFTPPGHEKSITELEFRKAVEIKIPTLIFLLDESAEWPVEYRDTGQEADKIRRLREELKQGKIVASFSSQYQLAAEVQVAIYNEIQAINKQDDQPKSSRIPNLLPKLQGNFVNREKELKSILNYLKDTDNNMVAIVAPGGYGKTELMAMTLKEIQKDPIMKGILYLKFKGYDINLGDIFTNAGKIANKQDEFLSMYISPDVTIDRKLEYFFAELSKVGNVLIAMDNFEVFLDPFDDKIIDPDLRNFLETSMSVEHAISILITSRAVPRFEGSRRIETIDLSSGLPEDKAILYLRIEGSPYGLDCEHEDNLREFVRRMHCIPKALKSVIGYLDIHYPTIRLVDLLDKKEIFEDFDKHDLEDGLKALIFQQYTSQSPDAKRLLESLSIFPKAVPYDAIKFLLKNISSTELAKILSRLVKNRLITYNGGYYDMHPIDRGFVYDQLKDAKNSLHILAADFYQNICCLPYGVRTSLNDIEPLLDAIWHLFAAHRVDDAAALFFNSLVHEDLYWWGYYDLLLHYSRYFLNQDILPKRKISLYVLQGKIERNQGRLKEALSKYKIAEQIINENDDPESEIGLYNALGDIYYFLGDFKSAQRYLSQGKKILANNPNPILQSENAGDLGNLNLSLRRHKETQMYYEQAVAYASAANSKTGNIYQGIWNGGLGNMYRSLYLTSNDPLHREKAIKHYLRAINIANKENDQRNESHFNGVLGEFYCQINEDEKAEAHLVKAFSISEKIFYGRMVGSQAKVLCDLYLRMKNYERAYEVSLAFQKLGYEIGNANLMQQSDQLLTEQMINRIVNLFQTGQIDRIEEEGRKFLAVFSGRPDMCASLGSIYMKLGRQTGHKDFYQLSVEAYTEVIKESSDDPQHGFYSTRADAYALLGKVEEAIIDYNEAMIRDPQNTGAALSRAEVQIWAGHYIEAKILLEEMYQQLVTSENILLGAWLMCHALNLAGQNFLSFQKILEDTPDKNVKLNYGVRDIEFYLQHLDNTKFADEQIRNVWMIQDLIKKYIE